MRSHLLEGTVMHERRTPVAYRFEHDVFYLAVDAREIDTVAGKLALLSRNGPNFASLNDTDHFDGTPLDEAILAAAEMDHFGDDARVTMVAYPRVAGYVFNPISLYLVHERGRLTRVVAEVHNTHGERFVYRLDGEADPTGDWRARTEKRFYVSPFIEMEGHYEFLVREDSRSLQVGIDEHDHDGTLVLRTGVRLRRRRLTNRTFTAALLRVPAVGLKTTALIHFHALRLWFRRLPFYSHAGART